MIRILVFSDTHGDIRGCERVADTLPWDYILHAGDYAGDYRELKAKYPDKNVIGVLGNNDFYSVLKNELLIVIGDKRIFMTHGHRY